MVHLRAHERDRVALALVPHDLPDMRYNTSRNTCAHVRGRRRTGASPAEGGPRKEANGPWLSS